MIFLLGAGNGTWIAGKSRMCVFEKWNFTGTSIKSRDAIASSAFYLYVRH